VLIKDQMLNLTASAYIIGNASFLSDETFLSGGHAWDVKRFFCADEKIRTTPEDDRALGENLLARLQRVKGDLFALHDELQAQKGGENAEFIVEEVRPSMIRVMSRLAAEHGAINLSQGYPNEGPPFVAIQRLINGLLAGKAPNDASPSFKGISTEAALLETPLQDFVTTRQSGGGDGGATLTDMLKQLYMENGKQVDLMSQYSTPWGRLQLREAVVQYYHMHYAGRRLSDDDQEEEVALLVDDGQNPGDATQEFYHYNVGENGRIEPEYVELAKVEEQLLRAEELARGDASTDKEADVNESLDFLSCVVPRKAEDVAEHKNGRGATVASSAQASRESRFIRELDAEKHITVSLGATEAMASVLRALTKPGDSIVVFEPCHDLYYAQSAIFHVKVLYSTLIRDEDTGEWRVNWRDVEEKIRKSRMIVINDPHNPTGKVFTRDELRHIGRLCLRYDTLLVTDDIYEHMLFTKESTPEEAQQTTSKQEKEYAYGGMRRRVLPTDVCADLVAEGRDSETGAFYGNRSQTRSLTDLTIMMNSTSKMWSLTGWRVGWIVAPEDLTKKIRAIHDQLVMQAATPLQYGAEAVLELPASYYYEELRTKYAERRKYLVNALRDLGFTVPTMPEGCYYIFAGYHNVPVIGEYDPEAAAMFLITEYKVAAVPGSGFYHNEPRNTEYLRFCYCRRWEDLVEGVKRLQGLKKRATEVMVRITGDVGNNRGFMRTIYK